VVLERAAGTRATVCGEFLSADAMAELAALGLDPAALGAEPVARLRLCAGEREAVVRLPFAAAGLPRRVLDEQLLALAEARGAEVRRGRPVLGLARAEDGWTAGEERAPAVFLATGKHDLRGLGRPGARRNLGLRLHIAAGPALRGRLAGIIELVLLPGGYAGLQSVGEGIVNLCLLAEDGGVPARADWPAIAAHLAARSPGLREALAGAVPLDPRPAAVARIPYGFVHRPAEARAGLLRIGDQAAVIPSFTGDGMAIALSSARVAADAFLAGGPAAAGAAQAAIARQVRRPMRLAAVLGTLLAHGGRAAVECSRLAPALAAMAARGTRLAMF
jgi:flavin-dependent dehydrogenase